MLKIFIVVYLLSAVLNYLYIHLAHSKRGIFERDIPNDGDVAVTFIPILNTIFCIFMWLSEWPVLDKKVEEKDIIPEDRSKFFNIKK